MYFPEDQTSGSDHNSTLPQFSELRSTLSAGSMADYTSDGSMQMQGADATSAYTIDLSQKQLNMSSKNGVSISSWSDVLMQLLNNPIMNIPSCSQNNSLLGIQANSLPASILTNAYLPSTSQADVKQEPSYEPKEQEELDKQKGLTEIFQRMQAAGISSSWQQLIKPQIEQIKKEKEQEKPGNMQNSILNIPMVFRNAQLQSSNNFCTSDLAINTDNLNNVQLMSEQQENNESNVQAVLKVEQQVQTDFPTEKKPRFRAKLDVKINVSSDGTVFYCCPECAFRLQEKAPVEQHIQTHLQERKYPCMHCDAKLKRKEHLDQHMRGHSDDRPFKCTLCPKAFKRNEHLTRHRSIHSGNKNFFCQVCNKAFSRKDHLNKHQQTHLGTRKKKENSYFVDQKEMMKILDKGTNSAPIGKQEVSLILPDDYLKQNLIQHIQKDSNLLQTFNSLKAMRENALQQAQGINLNELLSHITQDI